MDGIFSKLGLYDFMGIWGPGAIFVTYFTFTLHQPVHDFFTHCGIINPGITSSNLLILLYTAVAYSIGVALHESGRCIANLFGLFHARDIHGRSEIPQKPIAIRMFKCIQWEYQENIKSVIPKEVYEKMSFNKAISYLKYRSNKHTSRIDTYHSIYALARSLTLMFLMHSLALLISFVQGYPISIWFFLSDLILTLLFFIRSYRYHHFWVESVFTQYFYCLDSGEKPL